jgi:hypothetical protein
MTVLRANNTTKKKKRKTIIEKYSEEAINVYRQILETEKLKEENL